MNKHLLAELVDESDVICHLAAAVGVRLIVESPVRTIETNVHGTQNVLDAASKKKKLVFTASTSEVYGKSDKVPFHEDADLVLGPTSKGRWSYAASKALDEFLALSFWKEKKLPVIVARFFNTVGPRQTGRYGMVLPNFVRQALAGEPITVYGTGQQSRCFCDVRDCVQSVLHLLANSQAIGEVVNIGSTEEVSINNLALLVKQRSRQQVADHAYRLRSGIRTRIRRHAAAHAGSGKIDGAHRLPPIHFSERNCGRRDLLLPRKAGSRHGQERDGRRRGRPRCRRTIRGLVFRDSDARASGKLSGANIT